MIMRFFTFVKFGFNPAYDVEEFVDKHIAEFANNPNLQEEYAETFEETFDLLRQAADVDALRRYDSERQLFVGQVGQVALEAVAVGVALNLKAIQRQPHPSRFVERKIKSFWSESLANRFSAPGISGVTRLSQTVDFGQQYFRP